MPSISELPPAVHKSNLTRETNYSNESKSAIACAIKSFLTRIGLSVRAAAFDPTGMVSERLRDDASMWNLGGASLEQYESYVVCAIHLGSGPYVHTPLDVQVHIAKYTLVLLCVDEFEVPTSAMDEFMERLYSGRPQLHPILDVTVDILRRMKDYYSPFLVTQIVKSTVDFINSMTLDAQTEEMALRPSALPYVKFKRFYNGIGEAYAAFIWDKFNFPNMFTYIQALPDINIFCDYVNDIFSLYKEELNNDTKNFVHERAYVTKKDIISVLYDIVDETVTSTCNVRIVLAGEKERQTWEQFIYAYLAFHLETPRYRLHEILG